MPHDVRKMMIPQPSCGLSHRKGTTMTNYQSIIGKTILTGDRPTVALHIGHYLGSLQARVELQVWNCARN